MPSSISRFTTRKTVIDLYNEREQTPWYSWTIAVLSAALLLLSLLFFPVAFTSTPEGQTITAATALILSILFVVASYALSFILIFISRSWLFQFEGVYLPNLFASVMGLVNLICGLSIFTSPNINSKVIATLVVSLLSILYYTFCSLLVFRKIHMVRRRDLRQRQPSLPVAKTFTMPETELQRQQLLRLLLSQEQNGSDSPNNGPEATYKIHWPAASGTHTRRSTMSTLRNNMHLNRFSRRGSVYRHNRSQSGNSNIAPYRFPPAEAQLDGFDRGMPDVIVEEATRTSYATNDTGQSTSQGAPAPVIRPHVYNPVLPAFFDVHPGERIPSYHPRHPSTYTQSTPQLAHNHSLPVIGPNGYLVEKPEGRDASTKHTSRTSPRPLDNYTMVDDDQAVRKRMEDRNRQKTQSLDQDGRFRDRRESRTRQELPGDLALTYKRHMRNGGTPIT